MYEGLSGGGERLGSAYEVTNLPTIKCQLKKTGVRLGTLLNAAMGMGGRVDDVLGIATIAPFITKHCNAIQVSKH